MTTIEPQYIKESLRRLQGGSATPLNAEEVYREIVGRMKPDFVAGYEKEVKEALSKFFGRIFVLAVVLFGGVTLTGIYCVVRLVNHYVEAK